MKRVILGAVACFLLGWAAAPATGPATAPAVLDLGTFSVSLAVRDLEASRAFYEKLGFHAIAGAAGHYVIMQDATSTISLFKGMFEKNILTFNPGWDRDAKPLASFRDVRDIQRDLKAKGLSLAVQADEASSGTAFLQLEDPDGNAILLDQHVPRPK